MAHSLSYRVEALFIGQGWLLWDGETFRDSRNSWETQSFDRAQKEFLFARECAEKIAGFRKIILVKHITRTLLDSQG